MTPISISPRRREGEMVNKMQRTTNLSASKLILGMSIEQTPRRSKSLDLEAT